MKMILWQNTVGLNKLTLYNLNFYKENAKISKGRLEIKITQASEISESHATIWQI